MIVTSSVARIRDNYFALLLEALAPSLAENSPSPKK